MLWPLADHLGTIRDIGDLDEGTNSFGIANHRVYDSFGSLISQTNSSASIDFAYTGKFFDPDTGLSYHWNRWFDPGLGKWLTPDPIGFAAGDANLYRYVGNHATGAIDPSGLVEETGGGSSGRVGTFSTAFQAVAGAMVAKAAGVLHGMDSAEQVSSGAGNSMLWSATKMGVANGEHALGSIASFGTQEFAERQIAFGMSAAANTSVFFEQQHRDDIFRSLYFLETGEFAPPTALDVFHQFSSLSSSPRIADRSYDFLVTASSGLNATSARAGAPWGVVAETVVFELATMGIAPSIETAPVRLSRARSAADSSLHWIDNLPPWKNNRGASKSGFTGQFGRMSPNDIRFSQTTAGGRGRAAQLRESMRNGWNGPAVDAVRTPDGIVSLDNTRIAVARELGIPEVPVKIRLPSDPLPGSMLGRFGDARTWGEALLHRTGRQRPPLGPTGTPTIPRMPNSN